MTHNQDLQTTNASYNLIQQVDEQELQDISGGGIGCATVACLSALNAGGAIATVAKEQKSSYPNEYKMGKAATAAVVHTSIANEALKTATSGYPICPNCAGNAVKYVAAKVVGGMAG